MCTVCSGADALFLCRRGSRLSGYVSKEGATWPVTWEDVVSLLSRFTVVYSRERLANDVKKNYYPMADIVIGTEIDKDDSDSDNANSAEAERGRPRLRSDGNARVALPPPPALQQFTPTDGTAAENWVETHLGLGQENIRIDQNTQSNDTLSMERLTNFG